MSFHFNIQLAIIVKVAKCLASVKEQSGKASPPLLQASIVDMACRFFLAAPALARALATSAESIETINRPLRGIPQSHKYWWHGAIYLMASPAEDDNYTDICQCYRRNAGIQPKYCITSRHFVTDSALRLFILSPAGHSVIYSFCRLRRFH